MHMLRRRKASPGSSDLMFAAGLGEAAEYVGCALLALPGSCGRNKKPPSQYQPCKKATPRGNSLFASYRESTCTLVDAMASPMGIPSLLAAVEGRKLLSSKFARPWYAVYYALHWVPVLRVVHDQIWLGLKTKSTYPGR